MISGHPHRDTLEHFRRGRLAGAELLELDDHLRHCPSCRDAVRDQASAVRASHQALESLDGDHVTFEEMSRYVDRLPEDAADADQRAAVESHLEVCAMCRAEVDDLSGIVQSPSTPLRRPWRETRGARVAATVAAAVVGGAALLWIAGERKPEAPPVEMVLRRPPAAVRPAPPVSPSPEPATTPGVEVDPVERLPPALRGVAEALQRGTLRSVTLVASLQGTTGSQRGVGGVTTRNAPVVLAPVGTVIEDDRPTFRWSRASDLEQGVERVEQGVDQGVVQVFDGDYNLVLESAAVAGTGWKSTMPLQRAATYQWQVVLHLAEGQTTVPKAPDPPARFRILGAQALAELNEARRSGTKLEAGLICMREGLFEEGARLLAAAASAHPAPAVSALAAQARRLAAAQPRPR